MGQSQCCQQEGDFYHEEVEANGKLATRSPANLAVSLYDTDTTNAGDVFSITFQKPRGAELSLDIGFVRGQGDMPVRVVSGYLTEQFNRDHPESRVLPGDRIVAVNGTRGTANLMMKVLKDSSVVTITFVRPRQGTKQAVPLSLPPCTTVYMGKMSHDYLGDDIPVQLEIRCVDGQWEGEWVVMGRREGVQIELSGDSSHVWIMNTRGEERTELLGTTTTKGVLCGELFQCGSGGGCFELKAVDNTFFGTKVDGMDDSGFVRTFQDWGDPDNFFPIPLYDLDQVLSPGIGESVTGMTPSFGEFVNGTTPSMGEPVRGPIPSFGEPITGLTPSFGEPVMGFTPSFGEPIPGSQKLRQQRKAAKN